MRLVVDASVAVKWLVAEEDSSAAHRLVVSGDDLHAPRLVADVSVERFGAAIEARPVVPPLQCLDGERHALVVFEIKRP